MPQANLLVRAHGLTTYFDVYLSPAYCDALTRPGAITPPSTDPFEVVFHVRTQKAAQALLDMGMVYVELAYEGVTVVAPSVSFCTCVRPDASGEWAFSVVFRRKEPPVQGSSHQGRLRHIAERLAGILASYRLAIESNTVLGQDTPQALASLSVELARVTALHDEELRKK